jgi:hypothetical protein
VRRTSASPVTLDIYRGVIAGTRKRLYFCTTSGRIPGVSAGRRLAVQKSSGGSGEGVGPVAGRSAVAFLDLRALPAAVSCQQGAEVRPTGDLAAYREHRDGGGRLVVPHDAPQRDTEDAMPTLTRTQVAGIFAGKLATRSQFYDDRGIGLPLSRHIASIAPGSPDAAGATPGA